MQLEAESKDQEMQLDIEIAKAKARNNVYDEIEDEMSKELISESRIEVMNSAD